VAFQQTKEDDGELRGVCPAGMVAGNIRRDLNGDVNFLADMATRWRAVLSGGGDGDENTRRGMAAPPPAAAPAPAALARSAPLRAADAGAITRCTAASRKDKPGWV